MKGLVSAPLLERRILWIRGYKVMLDRDLADLYGVSTKRLNEQVRRNGNRFPEDFMIRLTAHEKEEVVANCDHLAAIRFSPNLPYAFTEHGAIMLAAVLNSPRAVESSIQVVRAFVRIREMLAMHRGLGEKLYRLELRMDTQDAKNLSVFNAIRMLMNPQRRRRPVGFRT